MPESSSCALHCAVQVGFAGSRQLFDLPAGHEHQRAALDQQIEELLVDTLDALPRQLGLGDRHFLCGISQIAIGADTIFTRACKRLDIPQRIFLPQPRDVYLAAIGSNGHHDFSAKERSEAEALLAGRHIIQERVVSDADDRSSRFEDCNREILLVSDVLVCLLRQKTESKRGGTDDLLSLAHNHGRKVLEIRVVVKDGKAAFHPKWHPATGFAVPRLPESIEKLAVDIAAAPGTGTRPLPGIDQYCDAIKQHASAHARVQSKSFSMAAAGIIATHVSATLCAAVALALHHFDWAEHWIAGLLALELLLLSSGWWFHRRLHEARPLELWADSRLLAEITRSVKALGRLHMHLAYLFVLRLPRELHPLLHTLDVLHLRSTRAFDRQPWDELRDGYLKNRLTDPDPKNGQIAFYKHRCEQEKSRLRQSSLVFLICSGLAILATTVKFAFSVGVPPPPGEWPATLGVLAIFLPTLAVGVLSWAAAKDYKARVQTFEAMLNFLNMQKVCFEQAVSAREFRRLVFETEVNLLGETSEWYARRTATSVA